MSRDDQLRGQAVLGLVAKFRACATDYQDDTIIRACEQMIGAAIVRVVMARPHIKADGIRHECIDTMIDGVIDELDTEVRQNIHSYIDNKGPRP